MSRATALNVLTDHEREIRGGGCRLIQQVRDAAIAGDPGGGGDLPGVAVAPVRGASGLLRLHGNQRLHRHHRRPGRKGHSPAMPVISASDDLRVPGRMASVRCRERIAARFRCVRAQLSRCGV